MHINGTCLLFLFLFTTGCFKKDTVNYKGNVSQVESIVLSDSKGEGSEAPDFIWYDSTGKKQSFRENIRGKVVMVNLWATWCPFCKAVFSAMRAIDLHYDDTDVLVFGINTHINTDMSYRVDYLHRFAKDRDFGYQLLLDTDKKEMWKAFGMEPGGVPATVLINRDGIIVKAISGTKTEELYKEELEKLMRMEKKKL